MRSKTVVITEDQLRLIYDIWHASFNCHLTVVVYTVHEYDNDTNIQFRVQNNRGVKDCILEYDNEQHQQYILSLTYNNNSYETIVQVLSEMLSLPLYKERIKKANTCGIFDEDRDIKIMTYMNSLDEHGNIVLKEEEK